MANVELLMQTIRDAGGLASKSQNILNEAKRAGITGEQLNAIAQQARNQHRTQWMEQVQTGLNKDATPKFTSFNLAPEAQFKVVKFKNGSVKKIPWDDPVPSDATVLNKKVEDLDAMGFVGKDPVAPKTKVDPAIQTAINAATTQEAPVGEMIAGTAAGVGVPAALVAQHNHYAPSRAEPTVSLTDNDNYPAYSGTSPVETAIRALAAKRPNEGLTENDALSGQSSTSPVYTGRSYETDLNGRLVDSSKLSNPVYPAPAAPSTGAATGANQSMPLGMDLSGSTNFNPSAMRFSTDKAPIVQAAQKAVQQTAPAASSSQSSGIANLLSSLFQNKGGEYQSTGERLYRGDMPEKGMGPDRRPTGVNFGDPDRASDFFRASKALQGLQGDQAPAEKRGGRIGKTNEHSAILHKALEIIHHMALKNH